MIISPFSLFLQQWGVAFLLLRLFRKLLRLENVKLFSRQDKILYILDTTILILYRKLYVNIVSIIVLNIETRQYNIKINLPILKKAGAENDANSI